jgi:NADPH2:quinone reductase
MTYATRVVVTQHGGPEVLQLEELELGHPKENEIQIHHHAVGINLADTYFRSGVYPGKTPCGLGVEASGIVTDVGSNVSTFQVGDRVTYTGSPLGAYSTHRNMPIDSLISLPSSIPFDVAAASTMRGLTASYLLNKIWNLNPGDTVLMHAAAGGVGLLFCQMAAAMGITVIGTVGRPEKVQLAINAGCAHVLSTHSADVPARVRELTNGKGVDVVIDGIGRDTFQSSLKSLKKRGLMVCLGTASGAVEPFDPPTLMRHGSIFITRPAMADYIADPAEKDELVQFLFAQLSSGAVNVSIGQRWQLNQAVEAHRAMESGSTVGSSIFDLRQSDI